MQKTILVFIAFLIACSSIPSESSVQTTIVQTQNSQPTITLEPTSTATPEPCAVLAREFYESISDLGLEWNENLSIVIGIGEVTEDDKTEAVAKMLSIYEEVKALTPPKCAQKMQEYLVHCKLRTLEFCITRLHLNIV